MEKAVKRAGYAWSKVRRMQQLPLRTQQTKIPVSSLGKRPWKSKDKDWSSAPGSFGLLCLHTMGTGHPSPLPRSCPARPCFPSAPRTPLLPLLTHTTMSFALHTKPAVADSTEWAPGQGARHTSTSVNSHSLSLDKHGIPRFVTGDWTLKDRRDKGVLREAVFSNLLHSSHRTHLDLACHTCQY